MPTALTIRDLRFRYSAASRAALSAGANGAAFAIDLPALDLAEGEHVLLTGRSGGGKRTLLQLIAGLREPDSGRVTIAGQDIHALRGAARDQFRGRSIGMIFQTFHLAQGFSALENVLLALLFGNPGQSRLAGSATPGGSPRDGGHGGRATELLRALGIDRPNALVETLSVGQQQRVAVARALACRPALVLADEPTASLDSDNAEQAVELIRSNCREQGAALLVASHDPSLRGRFDRTLDLAGLAAAGVTTWGGTPS